ncbi:3,4-dihydroxy-2-butanone-4-phosphate synthase [Vibrio nigripulchritudo SO65]|uniref:3,4-dihydroxy-2-butanone 4-phosphate synthase n=1 Tax=Vibrio nigripulchritudo SOn1 TaxID=1238450 RepID=A0AAV2VWT6_9VIBR|nr:3,4-dihydroxy-2-butanone-4-phosphate synthase [Vibrio nigripulchritudo]CCN35855.1 3,4-dihydroxy-2-butanone-4-phosphate synthase [Vibrio nigripulchritudo AM115]CCN39251.1 3,4-dihydroxy-2-butanone-4-phosphate synthase [Vibrio nigripulchritudo FTn2]CCN64879.1 3,4-dihydroxy-2-butanone-4-phosphate synthase [Vibrio nigripulchritudo POn4]CCN68521.1 3,4-dihydroxy-2-butanone-4-phosphate synthase [Vibrio nigripulchritudo SFn118]CCN79169.1 3,4-dihydroxy-2-butanone-4-phosphate synthase [Vibrio nigripul
MNQNQTSLLEEFGTPFERVEKALQALQQGRGVLLLDDEDRENEGDLIYSVDHLTNEQMALMIRECSGIVCLCLSDEHANQLELPPMVENNDSKNQTAFTVSIEAKEGVTTGVSAADRVTTIKTASRFNAKASDLARPGHVFPLRARKGGIMTRRGHTEGTIDLMEMAGLSPFGILCEVANPDGSMAKTPEIVAFGKLHNMPVLTIEDMVRYRIEMEEKSA